MDGYFIGTVFTNWLCQPPAEWVQMLPYAWRRLWNVMTYGSVGIIQWPTSPILMWITTYTMNRVSTTSWYLAMSMVTYVNTTLKGLWNVSRQHDMCKNIIYNYTLLVTNIRLFIRQTKKHTLFNAQIDQINHCISASKYWYESLLSCPCKISSLREF